MNIPDDLDIGEMGMARKVLKMGITCKLYNKTCPRCPQEGVGDCGKAGRKNCAVECSNIGACKGTYDAVKLEKGEKSRVVRSYAGVTREDVQTPIGQNIIYLFHQYICSLVTTGPGRLHPLSQRHGQPLKNRLFQQIRPEIG